LDFPPASPKSNKKIGRAQDKFLHGRARLRRALTRFSTQIQEGEDLCPAPIPLAHNNFLANSTLLDHIVFAHNNTVVMTTSNQFDKLNPLTGISSASSASQQWEYPREQIGTNNNSTPQWVGINVTAPGETMISGDVFLAQTPETNFTYDLDGNLTSDGRFNYT
jgi:hypothetical protein